MIFFTANPLCKSQILTQTTTILGLAEALIIWGFDAKVMLKMCISLMMPLMMSGVMEPFSPIKESPMIFKYNLDLGNWELSVVSELMLFAFLIHFSIIFKLEAFASLSVVMMTLSLMIQMKSAVMSDLISFRLLFMLAICWLAKLIINSVFDLTIEIIICFLNGPLVIMLILGFFCPLLLFLTLIILVTSSANKAGNTSLIHRTSSMFGDMLAFKAYI